MTEGSGILLVAGQLKIFGLPTILSKEHSAYGSGTYIYPRITFGCVQQPLLHEWSIKYVCRTVTVIVHIIAHNC